MLQVGHMGHQISGACVIGAAVLRGHEVRYLIDDATVLSAGNDVLGGD